MCQRTDFCYESEYPILDIRQICSKSTASNIRHLRGIFGLDAFTYNFQTADEMTDHFPRLDVLGLFQSLESLPPLTKQQYDALTYDSTVSLMQQFRDLHVRTMRLLQEARFKAYVNITLLVRFFGDNSRDIDRIYVSTCQ